MPGRVTVSGSAEVTFALPDRQELVAVKIHSGATVGEVIEQSQIAARFPEHDLSRCAVGIWGRTVARDYRVRDGDRIELYRELLIEPREARRQLARVGKTMSRHDDDSAGHRR